MLEIVFILHDGAEVSLKKDWVSKHKALLVRTSMKLESANLVSVRVVLSHSLTTEKIKSNT